MQLLDAGIIIAPHGGALSNLVFAPINTSIVEFLPLTSLEKVNAGLDAFRELRKLRQNSRPAFFGLATALGL
jgi:capsular polysaccharide biosynthesis protein